ncbi:hypothetical protein D3C77_648620 [compost metagenome]
MFEKSAVRTEKFNLLPRLEMIPLLDDRRPVRLIVFHDQPSEIIRRRLFLRLINMILMIRRIIEEPCIERTIRCFVNFLQPLGPKHIIFRISHIRINRLSVDVHNGGHVMYRFHPAFNFEAVNADID